MGDEYKISGQACRVINNCQLPKRNDEDEEMYKDAKTSVWWDINNCPLPKRTNEGVSISSSIRSALGMAGYRGPVSIFVYGDLSGMPDHDKMALLDDQDIKKFYVPKALLGYASKVLFPDMVMWVVSNHHRCNLMLITGDLIYYGSLYRMREKKVNVLLAHPPLDPSNDLHEAADHVWLLDALLAGEPPYKKNPAFVSLPSHGLFHLVEIL